MTIPTLLSFIMIVSSTLKNDENNQTTDPPATQASSFTGLATFVSNIYQVPIKCIYPRLYFLPMRICCYHQAEQKYAYFICYLGLDKGTSFSNIDYKRYTLVSNFEMFKLEKKKVGQCFLTYCSISLMDVCTSFQYLNGYELELQLYFKSESSYGRALSRGPRACLSLFTKTIWVVVSHLETLLTSVQEL